MNTINRLNLLKTGAALSLLSPTSLLAENKKTPKRILFINNCLGFYAPSFFPKNEGDLSSSIYLKDFKVKNKMSIFEKFYHPGMVTSNHSSEKSFLTGARQPEAVNFKNTVSLDQILAEHMGKETRFPYLNFSMYGRGWGCSFNEQGSALAPMNDTKEIFKKLFGKENIEDKRESIAKDQAIINSLRKDASHEEQYTHTLREMEAMLQHKQYWLMKPKPKVKNTLSQDKTHPFSTQLKNILELIKLSFKTDSTRVATFALDWQHGAISVPGANGPWHALSHHGKKEVKLKKLACVEGDILKHINQFLYDLDQIPEGKGSLLDHTTVLFGSNMGNASAHTQKNLPIVIAGGGYKHIAHKVLPEERPLCDLFVELLNHHGIKRKKFSSSHAATDFFTQLI